MPRSRHMRAAKQFPAASGPDRAGSALLFAAALVARLAFWRAAPDAAHPWSVLFKGDAPLWLEYAAALRSGQPFELGLPFHPPGNAYLLAGVWDPASAGYGLVHVAWAVMGAASVCILHAAITSAFGAGVGRVAGVLMAFSTGLLLLCVSPNGETPYLLLAAACLWLVGRLRTRPGLAPLLAYSAASGLACLFRVEHVLFYLASLAWLARGWRGTGGRPPNWRALAPAVVASLLAFGAALLPWHVAAWRAVARFNSVEPGTSPEQRAALSRLEGPLGPLPWAPEAALRRGRWPAFSRQTAATFAAATAAHRGARAVTEADLDALRDAFGYEPEPLARFPFVSLYGPLNFALANHAGAEGGFSRAPLEAPPPLAREPRRYPAALVEGVPPPQLSFVYPPHLLLVNRGYRLGAEWIASDPLGFLRLAGRKLARFWAGAALGWTGYGVPLGLGGVRHAVDLVVPDAGPLGITFRLAVFVACMAGVWVARPRAALAPWLLFLASRVVPSLLFFGYARAGATTIPVVALLLAIASTWLAARAGLRVRRTTAALGLLLALGAATELVRAGHGVALVIDGRPVLGRDPVAPDLHRDQRVETR